MSRITINVGKKHEQLFESVRFLIENGGLDGMNMNCWIENGKICTDDMEYVLSTVDTQDSEKTEVFGFGNDGASWFLPLRGVKVKNDDAVWMDFVDKVKTNYHKNYSVVEYKEQKKNNAELDTAKRDSERIARSFIKVFYPEIDNSRVSIAPVNSTEMPEEIVGVAMRVELAAAVTRGAPVPILGKLYFNRTSEGFIPITATVAQSIDSNISSIVPDESSGRETDEKETVALIDRSLDAVEDITSDENCAFIDYLCLSGEEDRKSINYLERYMSHELFSLECSKVDILYITHIKAESYVCDLNIDGIPALRVIMGINNRFTVKCLNCRSAHSLVERNEITYEVDGKKKTVALKSEKENFGLSAAVIDDIIKYSTISHHFKTVKCPSELTRDKACVRLRCTEQLTDNGSCCKDCPYPEVLYTHFDGNTFESSSLVFLHDTLELCDIRERSDKKDTSPYERCNVCGRTMSSARLVKKYAHGSNTEYIYLCRGVCDSAFDSDNTPSAEAKALYKKYRSLLPIHVRALAITSPKHCYEDEEVILFCIGNAKYIFNKLKVKASGYLQQPRRIK